MAITSLLLIVNYGPLPYQCVLSNNKTIDAMIAHTASFALALPDLGDLISLVGAVASSALALIFPPLLHILVFIKGDSSDQQNGLCAKLKQTLCVTEMEQTLWITRFKKAAWVTKDVLIMVFGFFGFALGTYASIDGLVKYFGSNSVGSVCVNFYPH